MRRRPSARGACLAPAILAVVASQGMAQKVPPGFKAELLASPPVIEHPSVVTCDDKGNLFVGEDPMDMRGPATKEFDRVIYFRWDTAGGPPKRTVFCENLSAVFGLIWADDALYVMHAPHYSRFRDTNGDGVADERVDLADGFGPAAGVFGFNDHIVAGIRRGMDGKVYVAVGDKGAPKAKGRDGSTISLEGGGVVRMNLDGTELEIVTSGTRNHLDVAMDARDRIFTYDNTDDGLGWWTRFTHHIPTGYYGYPYDYRTHPERMLPRISEHGGGSPCGAACYNEAGWPATYRGSPFFCEWGKGKVQRFKLTPRGATFEGEIEDFMTGDGTEFRPLDLCFSPDGKAMYVADWNFSGWTRPNVVGRLFRVTYMGEDVKPEPPRAKEAAPLTDQLRSLSHSAFYERTRAQRSLARLGSTAIEPLSKTIRSDAPTDAKVHAIWALNEIANPEKPYSPADDWIAALRGADPEVRAEAARALGLRRLAEARTALENALADADPTVRLWSAIALGRIGAKESAAPLAKALPDTDRFARFAMIQALRAIKNWPVVAKFLRDEDSARRAALLLALTGQFDPAAVDALADWASVAPDPREQAVAIAALVEVDRRADPYTEGWWGTQPAAGGPRRPRRHVWEATKRIEDTINAALASPSIGARQAALVAIRDLQESKLPPEVLRLATNGETFELRREAIRTLAASKDTTGRDTLARLVHEPSLGESECIEVVKALARMGAGPGLGALIEVARREKSPALVEATLVALSDAKARGAVDVIKGRLGDASPVVRAAAATAMGRLAGAAAATDLVARIKDADPSVRRAVLAALEELKAPVAVPSLIKAARDPETGFEATRALAAHADRRALAAYLDGLTGKSIDLRLACRTAVLAIRGQIVEDLAELHRRHELSAPARSELALLYQVPTPIASWKLAGAWAKPAKPTFDPASAPSSDLSVGNESRPWRELAARDPAGKLNLRDLCSPADGAWAVLYAEIDSPIAGPREMLIGSDDQATVWVNGEQVYEFEGDRGWSADQGKLRVNVLKGANRIWVLAGNSGGPWELSVQLSRRDPALAFLHESTPTTLAPEAYAEHAAKRPGDAARGKKLFFEEKGVGCVKCHAVSGTGGKVGPDLVGVGAKYARTELVRSILEPSNRILSGYQMSVVATSSGQVIQGIVRAETATELEVATADAKFIRIPKEDVEERRETNLSLMPNGLKDGMSLEDFTDIVAYLEQLKESPPTKP